MKTGRMHDQRFIREMGSKRVLLFVAKTIEDNRFPWLRQGSFLKKYNMVQMVALATTGLLSLQKITMAATGFLSFTRHI